MGGLLLVPALAGGAGCRSWENFDHLRTEASVTRARVDGEGGPRFGQVLFGYEVPASEMVSGVDERYVRKTRLFAGGASERSEIPGSYAVFPIWEERRTGRNAMEVRVDTDLERNASEQISPLIRGCHSEDRESGSTIVNCGSGRRAGAGFPYMHTSTGADWLGCVAVTAGEFSTQERLQIRCESIGSQMSLMIPLENGLGWGASASGMPIEHPFGVAVFGAPATDGRGAIFRLRHLVDQQTGLGMGQPEGGTRRGLIPITGLELEDGARFGSNVALTVDRSGGGQVIRIAATLGTDARRVVVAEVTAADAESVSAEVIGCLAGGGDAVGFGDALAWGDFDGDGHPDLAIGAQPLDATALPLDQPVSIFDGEDFGGARTCSVSSPTSVAPAAQFGCLGAAATTSVSCASSRFGQSLAAGDFDGDGRADLAVGAPGASTSRAAAGVVQTIAGEARLADMGQSAMRRGTLALASSGESAAFGTAVAAIPAPYGRSEVAASQAAPAATYIFYCSDLTGDTPSTLMVNQPEGSMPVRGCGIRPPPMRSSMLDPETVAEDMTASPDAGVRPDAGSAGDAGMGADAGP